MLGMFALKERKRGRTKRTDTDTRRLHTLGLRAHRRGRRLRRLVLPLPRFPLRHLGPHPQRTRAPQPRDPGVRLLRRRQAGCRLRERREIFEQSRWTDTRDGWTWCISVQYGVWVKQKRAPQGFRLQRPLIDHKPRSKPDCCLSLGKFLLSLTSPPPLDLVRGSMPLVQKDKSTGNAP